MTPFAIASVLCVALVSACVGYALRILEWWLMQRTRPAADDAVVQLREEVRSLKAEVDTLRSSAAFRGM